MISKEEVLALAERMKKAWEKDEPGSVMVYAWITPATSYRTNKSRNISMSDRTLAEVAADVAAALGLKRAKDVAGEWFCTDLDGYHALFRDGSNLTDPYWRCACEDWLLAQGWKFDLVSNRLTFAITFDGEDMVEARGPWPEAPARLVSAVWRRMQELRRA